MFDRSTVASTRGPIVTFLLYIFWIITFPHSRMKNKERIRIGFIILIVDIVATLLLMTLLKRLNLYGFFDMSFFVGVANLVIGLAVKGGRIFGKERPNLYKRMIPTKPEKTETEEEKAENKKQDIAIGWTFIICGFIWAGVGGLSYLLIAA